MSTSFDPVAYGESTIDFYDLLYPACEIPGIVDFIRKRLTEGSRIVELGAGTGRVAVPAGGERIRGARRGRRSRDTEGLPVKDPAGLVSVHQADFTRDVVGQDFDLCLIEHPLHDAESGAAVHGAPAFGRASGRRRDSWSSRRTNRASITL
ncbi:hypothetical protein ACH4JZ_16450 [Streptomyces sp. NPDC017615]|uniref:hypothetical protein n=1 Tax=Streptomyces sp. NPDC017615 TaxID=3365003 RepID=UPI0037AE93F2